MGQQEDPILYLSRKDVEQISTEINGMEIIRELFRLHASQETHLPEEAYLSWTNEQGEYVRNLNMPGYVGGSVQQAGTKIINGNILNPARGLPRASGVTLLYETLSGRVSTIMESALISSLRTAYVSALSVDLFRTDTLTEVAIIGTGILAQAHLRVFLKEFPSIKNVFLYDISQDRLQTFCTQMEQTVRQANVTLNLTAGPEEAIRAAEAIIPTTTTTEGYIAYSWLRAGAILVNISLDDPLPEVVLRADKVFVDDWHLVKTDTRRLLGRMHRAGQIVGPDLENAPAAGTARRVDGELGDVLIGKKAGRQSPEEIFLVNPFGLAIEDVAFAARIYRIALERGIGQSLER